MINYSLHSAQYICKVFKILCKVLKYICKVQLSTVFVLCNYCIEYYVVYMSTICIVLLNILCCTSVHILQHCIL